MNVRKPTVSYSCDNVGDLCLAKNILADYLVLACDAKKYTDKWTQLGV